MKVLGVIFAVLMVAVVAVLVLATTKPSSFEVERSIDIAAAPSTVEPLVSDFHQWKLWSPWEHLDPNMQVTYSGAPAGRGAMYDWKGNSKAGEGHMEVLATSPMETRISIHFLKPMEGRNLAVFTYTPTATGTHVRWVMTGPCPFASKVMQVFTTFDKLIGPDFEKGLASLKQLAEKK